MPRDHAQIVPLGLCHRGYVTTLPPFRGHVAVADMKQLHLLGARAQLQLIPPARILSECLAFAGQFCTLSLQLQGVLVPEQIRVHLAMQRRFVQIRASVFIRGKVWLLEVHRIWHVRRVLWRSGPAKVVQVCTAVCRTHESIQCVKVLVAGCGCARAIKDRGARAIIVQALLCSAVLMTRSLLWALAIAKARTVI